MKLPAQNCNITEKDIMEQMKEYSCIRMPPRSKIDNSNMKI